jgi:HAD superfamily hydrolase (TIGR01549 family)
VIKAVVFDVGETLIDETRIWSRWADRLGVPRLTFLGVLGGMAALDRPYSDAFALVRPGLDIEAEAGRWAAQDPHGLRENFDADDLYPDVRAALEALQRLGLTVVIAGNQPAQAKAALEAMALPVDAIFTSAQWGVEKPDQAFYRQVAQVCGVPPAHILYVGDRLDNDVLAAAQAGMRTALLRRGPWGYLHAQRPQAARADLIVDDLHEVVDKVVSL